MRRTNWKTVSTLVTMLAVAGCSESTVSPAISPSAASMQFAPAGRPSLSLDITASAATSGSIRVGPQGGVYFIGSNAVVFPRGSVCDPSSAYGLDTWDKPCAPLTRQLTIQYETSIKNGRTSIDFKTPLRFAPTNDPSQYVWMMMYTPGATSSSADLQRFTIYYTPTLDGPMYDEAASDPTLKTYVDSRTGISMRRIKHFSGYTQYGIACDPLTSIDPTCTDDGGSQTR
jgi:hypothetical protein